MIIFRKGDLSQPSLIALGFRTPEDIPSRERSHIQPWEKKTHRPKTALESDVLVPRRVFWQLGVQIVGKL